MTQSDDEKFLEEWLSREDMEVGLRSELKVALLAGIAHEREKHRWISVKERLPESQGEFLIYSTSDPRLNAKSKYLGNACFLVFSGKAFKTGFYIDSMYEPSVTHWMPLPDPPESSAPGVKQGRPYGMGNKNCPEKEK